MMCEGEATVRYAADAGPVTLEIRSGYATIGNYRACIDEDNTWPEFGNGSLSDSIPDIHVIPIAGTALESHTVLIVGNYAPPSTDPQVRVIYEFRQGSAVLETVTIQEKPDGYVSCSHMIYFEARS